MVKFRSIAKIVVMLMVISLCNIPVLASSNYSDTAGHWAVKAIDRWSDYGVINGYQGQFRPNDPITRAEMAAVLDKIMKYRAKADNNFSDLDENWYTDSILKVNFAEVMVGSDGKVRPKDNITRQEAVVMVCKALDIPESNTPSGFVDSDEIGAWALGYVNAMANLGYISGVGGNRFAPRDNITRAAVVTILDNVIKALYQEEGTYTGNVDGVAIVSSSGTELKDMNITGDIIISEGVGDGEVVLDSVKTEGTLIVRGGGVNSIIIRNSSVIPKVLVNRRDGVVAVKVEGNSAEVGHIAVLSDGAVITAPMATVAVAEGVTGTLVNGIPVAPGQTVLASDDPKDDIEVSPSIPVPTNTETNSSSSGSGSSKPKTTTKPQNNITAISLDTEVARMDVADILELNPVLTPSGLETEINWTSSDSDIAFVNSEGVVVASCEGVVTITAKTSNNLTATCFIAVSEPESLTVNYPGTVINGGTYQNVTISEDVGESDVNFNDVTITGALTVNGGGSTSIHFNGNSYAKDVVVNKTVGEIPRFLMNDASSVTNFNVSGDSGAILERGQNATGKVTKVEASKPLIVRNTDVPEINTSSELELDNAEVTKVTTTGESTINLKGQTKIDKLQANAKTMISAESTGSIIEEISSENAEVETDEKSEVGLVKATEAAKITVKGLTKHIDANGGDIFVLGDSSPVISGSAGTVSVGGNANPIITANATAVEIHAGGGAGITVTGSVGSINTTGSGSIGSINIESGSPTVSIAGEVEVEVIAVSGAATPQISGEEGSNPIINTIVSTSSNTVTVNVAASTVIAQDPEKIEGEGAENVTQAVPVLNSIELTSLPKKLVYSIDDTDIDTAGMVVTGNYTVSGVEGFVKKVLSESDYDVTGWSGDVSAGEYTITVTETESEKSASFSINVVAKEVESISLTALPTKLIYEVDDEFSLAGGELTVYYTNKTLYPSEEILLTDESVEVTGDTATVGVKTITVEYGGKSVRFNVTVKDSIAEALAQAKLDAEIELREFTAAVYDEEYSQYAYSDAIKTAIIAMRDNAIQQIKDAENEGGINPIKEAAMDEIGNIRILVGNTGYSDLQTAINAATSTQTVDIVVHYYVTGEDVTIPAGKKVVNKTKLTIENATLTVENGGVLTNEGRITVFDVSGPDSCLNIEEGGTLSLKTGSYVMTFHGGDNIKLEVYGTLNAQQGAFIIVLGGSVTGINGIETGEGNDGGSVYRYNGSLWKKMQGPDLEGFEVSIKSGGDMSLRSKAWMGDIYVQVDNGSKRRISRSGNEYIVTGSYDDGEPHKVIITVDGKWDLIATALYIDSGTVPNLSELTGSDSFIYYSGGAFVTVAGNVTVDGEEFLIPRAVTIDVVSGGSIDLTDKEITISPTFPDWAGGGKSELVIRYGGSVTLKDGTTIGSEASADVKLGENSNFKLSVYEDFSEDPEGEPIIRRQYVAGGTGTIGIPASKSFSIKAKEKMIVEPDTELLVNGTLSCQEDAILEVMYDGERVGNVNGDGSGISGIKGEGEYVWSSGKWEIVKRFRANRMDVILAIYDSFSEGFGLREASDIGEYSDEYSDLDTIDESETDAVAFMIENNIIQGNGEELNPYGIINRAELMILFNRLLDSMEIIFESYNPDIEFTDVSESDYFYDAVMMMARAGVANGIHNPPDWETISFMPLDPVGIEPLEHEGGKSELEFIVERFKNEVKNRVVNRFDIVKELYRELIKEEYCLETPSTDDIEGYAVQYDDWGDLISEDWFDNNFYESLEDQNEAYQAMMGLFVKNGIIDETDFDSDGLIDIYEPMTKAEIMVFLDVVSKVVMQDEDAVLPGEIEIDYEDVNEGDWFYGGVMNMARAGVVETESGTLFQPYNLVNRFDIWGPDAKIDLGNYVRAFETVMPKVELTGPLEPYEAKIGENEPIRNKLFKVPVTITGQQNGRIDFINCEFEQGIMIEAGGRFEVNLGRSVVNNGIVVEGDENLMFDDDSEVFIRNVAPGTDILATEAKVAVECKVSGGSFTLNGAVITAGEFEEDPMGFSDDKLFYAGLRWMCIGNHEGYGEDHFEHIGVEGLEQAPMLEFRGAIDNIVIDDADEFIEFHMVDDNATGDIELTFNKSTSVAGGEIRINKSENSYRSIIVNGSISGNDLVIGDGVDVSGVEMDGGQIRVNAWGPDTSVGIGNNTLYVMDDCNVSITAVSGATVIIRARNAGVNVVNSITEGVLNIGKPHVFADDGGYKIHVGTGDSTGFTFTLMQGEATLE